MFWLTYTDIEYNIEKNMREFVHKDKFCIHQNFIIYKLDIYSFDQHSIFALYIWI